MATTTRCLAATTLTLTLAACGGSSGDAAPPTSPPGTGGGGTSCTFSVTGDAASGVASATLPCGFPSSLSAVGPPVEFVSTIAGSAASYIFLGDPSPAFPNATVTVFADQPLIAAGTYTDQGAAPAVGFGYLTSTAAAWMAGNGFGSYTLTVSALTPASTAECASSVVVSGLFPPHACYRVHGSAHAVLVPNAGLGGNTAAGTVTLDVTF